MSKVNLEQQRTNLKARVDAIRNALSQTINVAGASLDDLQRQVDTVARRLNDVENHIDHLERRLDLVESTSVGYWFDRLATWAKARFGGVR